MASQEEKKPPEKLGKGLCTILFLIFCVVMVQAVIRAKDRNEIDDTQALISTSPMGEDATRELHGGDLAAAGNRYAFGPERNSIRVEGRGEKVKVYKFHQDPSLPALTVEMDRGRDYVEGARARNQKLAKQLPTSEARNESPPSREDVEEWNDPSLVPSVGPHGERLIGGKPIEAFANSGIGLPDNYFGVPVCRGCKTRHGM